MPIQRLILEGENDKHVISNLLEVLKIPDPESYTTKETFWNDFLKANRNKGGKSESLKLFKESLKEELNNLGLIIDADESVGRTWQSIRTHLLNARFSADILPISPLRDGTVIKQIGKPIVGIWIMPDNLRPENDDENEHFYLEHFFESLIRQDDILLRNAHDTVNSIVQLYPNNELRFKNVHFQKAKIHSWLAWIDEPGDSMGRTLKKERLFDFNNPLLTNFITWYKSTFQL